MNIKLEVNLPFPGFYQSLYDCEIDCAIERDCEYFSDEWGVSVEDVSNAAFSHVDCSDAHKAIAELHATTWLEVFRDETGIDIYSGFKFFGMTSPKFYNFETDRVFAQIPLTGLQECFNACRDNGFKTLQTKIAERFTSCSGFISFYSNRIADWLEKPLQEWDCNELCTLITATIDIFSDSHEFQSDVEIRVLEHASGNGFCEVVNWAAVEVELKAVA